MLSFVRVFFVLFFLLDNSFFKNLINQKKGPILSKYDMYSYDCIHTLCKYRGGFIRQTNSCLQGKFSDKRERLRERWLCETHNTTLALYKRLQIFVKHEMESLAGELDFDFTSKECTSDVYAYVRRG